jgi:hypothetical protein
MAQPEGNGGQHTLKGIRTQGWVLQNIIFLDVLGCPREGEWREAVLSEPLSGPIPCYQGLIQGFAGDFAGKCPCITRLSP